MPPADAMASSTALLLPAVSALSKPTTKTLMPAAKSCCAAVTVAALSRQSLLPSAQLLCAGVGPQPGVVGEHELASRLTLQLGRPSVINSTYAAVVRPWASRWVRTACSEAAVGVPPPGTAAL